MISGQHLFLQSLSLSFSLLLRVVSAPSWRWDAGRSARHNQDLQRDRESHVMKDLTGWLSLARSPDSATLKPTATESKSSHGPGKHDPKRKEPPAISPGIYYKMEVEFKQRHSGHHPANHGAFRAKVQAISRLKMRLRNRSAFSAKPWRIAYIFECGVDSFSPWTFYFFF